MASKFGGKYTLGLGILSTGIFTVITPWVITSTGGDWRWVVALRVAEGLGEVGVVFVKYLYRIIFDSKVKIIIKMTIIMLMYCRQFENNYSTV